MAYLDEDFLLHSPFARRLFHEVARDLPIIDYHSHLSPTQIANNHRWQNLTDIWLDGDHYKWRLMRANGIAERRITGDASAQDRLHAWAETVPFTLRNPIHHWTHLELRRYFGIEKCLSPTTADEIWQKANAFIKTDGFSVWEILAKFKVEMVGTTDDPADDLAAHQQIADSHISTRTLPTFRPDRAFAVDDPPALLSWLDRLGRVCGKRIDDYAALLEALGQRHEAFHAAGARLSDHGLESMPECEGDEPMAAEIFARAIKGHPATAAEKAQFTYWLMIFFAKLDAARGWAKQLHLGAFRNGNRRMFEQLGADAGYDTIGDAPQLRGIVHFLSRLAQEDSLPKIILYNSNPRDNYLFAALTGVFQDGTLPGKIQFGSAWWFMDQKDGIELQLNALSATGLLSRFIGMLTDSRSFLSFPRHEYFRRILCNLLGGEAQRGELPDDFDLLASTISAICYSNARDFIGLKK